MSTPGFTLLLSDARSSARFEQVAHFIGADETGSFGILPRHAECVAVLRYGLARFAGADGQWQYLALPGAVLHFHADTLHLMAERYFLGTERAALVAQMTAALQAEDSELRSMRATLDDIERTLLRRLGSLHEGALP